MNALRRIVGVLMVLGGIAGVVACAWALVDPSIMPAPTPLGAFDAPSPRWRAALGLVVSLGVALFGSGRLRHRELP
ncbi:hypothetical protein [Luteimonas sp. MC1750]|uniref:hypothetical protein n=1 Tax=Luteimonas sp. MC1750 TaxID=2799326 RepID=UPI0018F09F50|nr:hypothetical protein [Luteimonas sp. MC1750]MBJ6985001.1 hypothetical protein [Luteimonas sp. MC1750]QQO05670.1 hypothetical protein JGR68_12770 [Luteimonas sp. MC1750]